MHAWRRSRKYQTLPSTQRKWVCFSLDTTAPTLSFLPAFWGHFLGKILWICLILKKRRHPGSAQPWHVWEDVGLEADNIDARLLAFTDGGWAGDYLTSMSCFFWCAEEETRDRWVLGQQEDQVLHGCHVPEKLELRHQKRTLLQPAAAHSLQRHRQGAGLNVKIVCQSICCLLRTQITKPFKAECLCMKAETGRRRHQEQWTLKIIAASI